MTGPAFDVASSFDGFAIPPNRIGPVTALRLQLSPVWRVQVHSDGTVVAYAPLGTPPPEPTEQEIEWAPGHIREVRS